jgi:hypothetical protein
VEFAGDFPGTAPSEADTCATMAVVVDENSAWSLLNFESNLWALGSGADAVFKDAGIRDPRFDVDTALQDTFGGRQIGRTVPLVRFGGSAENEVVYMGIYGGQVGRVSRIDFDEFSDTWIRHYELLAANRVE